MEERGEEGGGGAGVSQEGGEQVLSVPRMVPGCKGEGIASKHLVKET